jgi:hypothetical protein
VQADGNSTGVGNPPGYCYAEQPPWSAYRESSFGHGTLDIFNSTHALWQCALTLTPASVWQPCTQNNPWHCYFASDGCFDYQPSAHVVSSPHGLIKAYCMPRAGMQWCRWPDDEHRDNNFKGPAC